MSLVKWSFIGLLVLPAAEVAAFLLVAALIGWLAATTLFVATSIIGFILLRRSGRGDLDRLRAAFAQDGIQALHLETPGAAPMLGGILLIFPGFITDILGAALFLPPLRRWAVGRLARAARERRRARRDDHVIDLAPDEWHQIPDRRGRPKASNTAAKEPIKRGSKGKV
jgi:UPF0716 family protein affecting phage T7 exclusion